MKTCISTYSFGPLRHKTGNGIYWVIDKVAELGFDGIEFIDGDWTDDWNVDTAKRVGEYARQKGLELVCLSVAADFVNGSGGDLNEEVKKLQRLIDFGFTLGVTKMRHDAAFNRPIGKKVGISFDRLLPRIAEGCREATKYAEQKGIMTMTENHGQFAQDSVRVEKLIEAVDHENFGALIDVGNFMCADEDPTMAVGVMSPYARHVHVKDFHFKSGNEVAPGRGWFTSRAGNYLCGTVIGYGDAKVAQSIRTLKQRGYDGFLSIEFEGLEDRLPAIETGLENLKRFMS